MVAIGCGVGNYVLYEVCMRDLHIKHKGKGRIAVLAVLVLMSALFCGLFSFYGYGPVKILKYCLLMGGLVLIAYEDWREKRIPNRWLVYLLGIRAVLFAAESLLYPSACMDNIRFTLSGGICSGAVLFLAYVISRHEIGIGDVKLFIVMGLYLGVGVTYFALLLSLILAAVYSIFHLLTGRLKAKDEIAFGPYVAIGPMIILGLGF